MTDPFNIVFHELMQLGLHERVANGEIPEDDFVIAVADYLVINCIGMGQNDGLEEARSVNAIQRIKLTLANWKNGKHPFENDSGTKGLS